MLLLSAPRASRCNSAGNGRSGVPCTISRPLGPSAQRTSARRSQATNQIGPAVEDRQNFVLSLGTERHHHARNSEIAELP